MARFEFLQNLHVAVNRPITLALQGQAATFIASDGQQVDQLLPVNYFEVPIQSPLPVYPVTWSGPRRGLWQLLTSDDLQQKVDEEYARIGEL